MSGNAATYTSDPSIDIAVSPAAAVDTVPGDLGSLGPTPGGGEGVVWRVDVVPVGDSERLVDSLEADEDFDLDDASLMRRSRCSSSLRLRQL